MITEIARISVKQGMAAEFEAMIAKARDIFKRSKGYKNLELQRSIEKPDDYLLVIQWESLEAHTVDFRGSENFKDWRALAGPYFTSPPQVEHTNTVVPRG